MLPLNHLAQLSETYAKQNEEIRDLENQVTHNEREATVFRKTKWLLQYFERNVMTAIRQGKKQAELILLTTMSPECRFTTEDVKAAILVLEEITKQGFHITTLETKFKNQRYPMTIKYTIDEFKKIEKNNNGQTCRGYYQIYKIIFNWKTLTPDPSYHPPDFDEKLAELEEKNRKLMELNRKAQNIIQEN